MKRNFIDRFISNKKAKTENITQNNYKLELGLFVNYLNRYNVIGTEITNENLDVHIKDICKASVILDYKSFLIEGDVNKGINPLKPASISKKIVIIKDFLSFLYKIEAIDKDVSISIDNVKVPNMPVITLNPQDIPLVIKKLETLNGNHSKRDRLMILMMLTMGLRNTELRSIRISNINFDEGSVSFKAKRDSEGQTTTLDILDTVLEDIKDYIENHRTETLSGEDYLFTSQKGTMLAAKSLGRTVKKRLLEIGIEEEIVDTLTPHKLRGSFATFLSYSGENAFVIQNLMRHKSPNATAKYVRVNDDDRRAVRNSIFGGLVAS